MFYRHYTDKYDLAKHVHLHEYYRALDNVNMEGEKGPNMWGKISRIWFDVIKTRPQFYQNIYRSNSGGEFKRIVRNYIMNFYKGILQYQLGNQIDSEALFVIELYLAGATEKINDWVLNGAKLSVEELNRLLYLSMSEKIRNMIVFSEVDVETEKRIARAAYEE